MRKRCLLSTVALLLVLLLGATTTAFAANPALPMWEHIADGEPHVFGDRVYVYGSHDTNSAEFQYCGQDYIVWSAPVDDLTDWSYSVYPSIDCGEGGGGCRIRRLPGHRRPLLHLRGYRLPR